MSMSNGRAHPTASSVPPPEGGDRRAPLSNGNLYRTATLVPPLEAGDRYSTVNSLNSMLPPTQRGPPSNGNLYPTVNTMPPPVEVGYRRAPLSNGNLLYPLPNSMSPPPEASHQRAQLSNGNLYPLTNSMLPPPETSHRLVPLSNSNPYPTGDLVSPPSRGAVRRRLLAHFLRQRIHGYANLYDNGAASSGIVQPPEAAGGSSAAHLDVDPRLCYGYATNCNRNGAGSSSNSTMSPSYPGLHAPTGMPLVAHNGRPQPRLPLQPDNFPELDFSQINSRLNALTIDAPTSLLGAYVASPRLGNGHGAACRRVSGDGYNQPIATPALAAPDIGALARDHDGCKSLCVFVAKGGSAAVRLVFDEVVNDLAELLNHPVGADLLDVLVTNGTDDMFTRILRTLEAVPEEVISAAMSCGGSKALQSLIEKICKNPDQVAKFIEMIHTEVPTLVKDQAGSSVLKKCLQCFPREWNWFIFSVVLEDPRRFSIKSHSCVVVQRCIDKGDDRVKGEIVDVICEHGLELAQHSSGNYVVQHVMKSQPWANERFAKLFRGQYAHLSIQKYSSNVVQRCLETFAPHRQAEILRELLDDTRFLELIQDQYANYVIQTALEIAPSGARQELRAAILPYKEGLRDNVYSKRIFSILRKQSSSSI